MQKLPSWLMGILAIILVAGAIAGEHFIRKAAYDRGYNDAMKVQSQKHVEASTYVNTDMRQNDAVLPYKLHKGERISFNNFVKPTTTTWALEVTYISEMSFSVNGKEATWIPGIDGVDYYILTTIWDKDTTRRYDEITDGNGDVKFTYSTGGGERLNLNIRLNLD